jgi:hypothetical protein
VDLSIGRTSRKSTERNRSVDEKPWASQIGIVDCGDINPHTSVKGFDPAVSDLLAAETGRP